MRTALAPDSTLFVHLTLANGFEPIMRWTCPVASCAVSKGTGISRKQKRVLNKWLCLIFQLFIFKEYGSQDRI